MNNTVEDLVRLIARLAHKEMSEAKYVREHKTVVRRTILSWASDPLLGKFYRRLLVHCDVDDLQSGAKHIVHLTHEYMVGSIDITDYVHQLNWTFSILDRRNSVPSIIGIRARLESNPYYLAPMIKSHSPIDPSDSHKSNFKTTVEAQRFARVEIYKGVDYSVNAPGSEWLCGKRFNLPHDLPKGTRVVVSLERISATGLRLTISIPESDYKQSLLDYDGFEFLTSGLEDHYSYEFMDDEWSKVRNNLLRSCSNFLTNFRHLLPAEYTKNLESSVVTAAQAFEVGDKEAVKHAVDLLFEGLQESLNASLVFTAETLLTETAAPASVTNEFTQLAQLLLSTPEDNFAGSRIERERVFALTDQWANVWRRSTEPLEVEDTAYVSVLFDLQNTLRHLVQTADGFANGAHIWLRLETMLELSKKLLAKEAELDNYQRVNLERLLIEAKKALAARDDAAARRLLSLLIHNLQGLYTSLLYLVLDRLAQATLVTPEIGDKLAVLRDSGLTKEELDDLLALWSKWYVAWTKSELASLYSEEQQAKLAIDFELLEKLGDLAHTTSNFVQLDSVAKASSIRTAFARRASLQSDDMYFARSEDRPTAELIARNLKKIEKAKESGNESIAEAALVNLLRDLQPNLESAFAFTAEAILEVTAAPEDARVELREIIRLLRLEATKSSSSIKQRMASLVKGWYKNWQ